MRRTMSVRLGNDSKATLSTEVTMTGHGSNPNLNVYVLVRLGSPTTGRILHRTAVKGVLIRLSSTQVLSTSLAGASAFAALAGANDNLQPRDSTVWGRMPEQDPTPDRLATSLHPSTGVGIAAAEHAAKMLGPDCMVQCRTPPCPLALLLNASSFVATVEVSLNGSDGQFSCDNVQYEYVRPLTLKAVLPQGDQLVPGCSVLMLKGHSIVSSKALTIHMSLLAAPEGGTSTFGHVRTLERLVLSYKTIQRRLNTAVEAGAVGPLAGEDPDFTQVCASVPFFIRRRYFNCHARCLPMFARVTSHTANMSPGCCAERFGYIVSVRELRLWVHSQPVADDTKRRLDTENAASKLDISAAEKGMRVRRASIRRQMSSSPQRNLLRQLSRTESLKHSGNSLVRQLSEVSKAKYERDPNGGGKLAPGNVNNSIISLWVDVCILGGSVFTGKPLLFLLYDHFPKLIQMRPRSGLLSGGYKVHLIGSGFLKTNSITARIVPLPTSMDFSAARSRRSPEMVKLLASRRQRRRGAVLDQRNVQMKVECETRMTGLDPMWPLTSFGNKQNQVRPVAVRCRCD